MKAVLQRVNRASVFAAGKTVSEIGRGLCVYLGIERGDGRTEAEKTASKLVNLRIFPDANGKMNLSLKQVSGELLLISNFTLISDPARGSRPSFSEAERPEKASELFELTAREIEKLGIMPRKGVFGADMTIEQVNDGPVTLVLVCPPKKVTDFE